MLLRTLGGLELEGPDFTQPQPLILLSYLCLEGKTSRQALQELFWPEQEDSEKRSKSLHTLLKKLLDMGLVRQNATGLESTVPCDGQLFSEACRTLDKKALELYQGPFLRGLESHKRLQLGPDMQNWLLEKRNNYHELWTQFLLDLAEVERDQSNLKDAAAFAWRAFKDSQHNYPEEKTLRRIYGLLLAGKQKRKAELVKQEAETVYSVHWQDVAQLPDNRTPFMGRQRELRELREVLRDDKHKLITLTGLGGVGKTALALAAAKALRFQFSRVTFVPLESFPSNTDELTLLSKIVSSFQLELPGRMATEALARDLGHEPSLLVLDNLEHLLHLKPILSRLLKECSSLTMLVTSRQELLLPEEHVIALEGLITPPTAEADFTHYSASHLFLELCKAKGVDVSVQKQDVLELCHRVAGLPLALHLAAAWVKVLPIAELLKQFDSDLEFLNKDSPEGKERHTGIRKVFDVSFDSLTSIEQKMLIALAVFKGKFSFASVNAILKVPLITLKRFVETSLLRSYPSDASYDLHPLLKQYLGAKLQGDVANWQRLQGSHAAYYLTQLTRKDMSQKRETRERLGKESANVFAAWRHTLNKHDWTTLFDLAPSLETFCDETAQHSDGVLLFAEAIASAPELKGAWLGRMYACRAWLEMRLGRTLEVQRHAKEALALLTADDIPSRSSCLIALASTYEEAGEFEAARDAFVQELALHGADSPEAISSWLNLSTLHLQLGDYGQAKDALDKAEVASLAIGSDTHLRRNFIGSRLLTEQGAYLQARVLLESLLHEAQAQKLTQGQKNIEVQLARVFLELGEVGRSVWLAQNLLSRYDKDRWLKAKMQLVLADAAMLQDDKAQALRYYNESLKTVLPTQSVPAFLLRLSRLAKVLLWCGEVMLSERLLSYCLDPKQYRRMSFVDRQSLDSMTSRSTAENSLVKQWQSLEPAEVALLVVSDVNYLLENISQGESVPALVK